MSTENKKLLIIFSLAGLLLIGGGAAILFQNTIKTAFTATETHSPKFVFASVDFPDWASAGNTGIRPDDGDDTAPVASIMVSQCTEGSNCSDLVKECRLQNECDALERLTRDGCFIQAGYFDRSINLDTAISDELQLRSGYGANPEQTSLQALHMSTPEGNKEYQLYQYDTNNTSGTYRRGSAFGFVPLENGHIKVQSVCWEVSQLGETLPALEALRLEAL